MSDYVIHEEEYKGLTIKIEQDDDPSGMNPVEDWDMLGKQVYWHRRMNLGHCWNETNKYSPEEWFIDQLEHSVEYGTKEYDRIENANLEGLLKMFEKQNLILPVSAYEHGGITISASGRRAGWDSFDSGQLGFVYVSHEDIKKHFQAKRLTKNVLKRAEECLIAEVSEYDDYLNGNVWGYIISDESEENLESCWGFLGDYKYCLEEARSTADYLAKEKEAELELYDKRMMGE